MNIYYQGDIFLGDIPLTPSAEHEEELMKSDFVRLSWSDATLYELPADAYIEYNGLRYSLLEPYEPEQKSECEWHYEPQFQHPKMYLSKVPFKRDSKDSDGNDIMLIDWSYTGFVDTLLQDICDKINEVYGFVADDDKIYPSTVGEIENIISITFSAVDILSALSSMASTLECEWHIDWHEKRLYFGHIMIDREEVDTQVLEVGVNVGAASVRSSKEGYWNAFEPQGSTRNITRRAASGENVQSNVRLALDKEDYPDGIIYTDSEGNVITKSAFDASGERLFLKTLIFDDVYPKLDLYVYDVRYRERYLLDEETEEKVVDHYDNDGKPVYKRYAVWFMRLAYPIYHSDGTIKVWRDYTLDEQIVCKVKSAHHSYRVNPNTNTQYITVTCVLEDIAYKDSYFLNDDKTVSVNVAGENYVAWGTNSDGLSVEFGRFDTVEEADSYAATLIDQSLTILSGVDTKEFDDEYRHSQVVDGKTLMGAFQPNTTKGALSCPLAGRGNGEDGYYGFELNYRTKGEVIPADEEKGDTGVTIKEGDYEIVLQQTDDYILPTTAEQMLVPKGETTPSLKGNIVNLYNIVMSAEYIQSSQNDLANKTLKYIANQFTDDNSYTFPSNPVAFEEDNTQLYIGQKVIYRNSGYELETRVMRIVTKIDFGCEQEITVGNEVLKGAQTTLKEQVETIISGGAGGTGGGVNESQVRRLIQNWVTPRFLSKVTDDIANGVITFAARLVSKVRAVFEKGISIGANNTYEIDESGNATLQSITAPADKESLLINKYTVINGDAQILDKLNVGGDATVDGILKALARIISNNITSDNYTGDGAFDTGFQIAKNPADGITSMVVDNLFVRMKAIFTELEIRKISYSGGNIIFSHAGSKIVRVEAMYEEGAEYEGNTVIISDAIFSGTTAETSSMAFEGNSLNDKHNTEDIVSYRCYLLKDDGTTQTENWWRVDDQARCQTFNIKEGVYQNVSNSFYWRRVTSVGSKVLEDGNLYDYVDLSATDCYLGQSIEGVDVSNLISIPQAGDQIVQMGNRTDTSRQGFITIEVAGEYAPAFKMYKNVRDYSLDGKRKIIISPRLSEFKAQRFIQETDYDVQVIPMERGDWDDITPDEQGKRRCYYYDLVQHKGASWLCVYPESGIGGVMYTTDEPSSNAAYWKPYAQKGEKGDSVSYDAEHSSVGYAYSSKGSPETGRDYPSDITSWSDRVPAAQKGKYLWTRDITAYNNAGTIEYTTTYGVEYQPNDGDSVEIDTARTFIKYCKQSKSQYTGQHPDDSAFSTDYPSSLGQGDYLWVLNQVAYVGVSDPLKSYSVSMLGTDGSKGDPGTDGYTTHFAYATSADGSQGFSTTNFNGATYIGTYRDKEENDSEDYRDYTWTRWRGNDGTSIHKVGDDLIEYVLSTDGVNPKAGESWSTTKPTPAQGEYVLIRTTISWSDETTTVLMSSERNPNDGKEGQDIIVDGATVMKYCCTESNTTHPAEDSSDWKSLSQITQTQGWYLWSQATTWYRKAKSASGAHDAGKSVVYNVSYIAEDGDTPEAARSIESVTEYYKATNSNSPMSKPTSDTGWSTDPNLSDLTDKWDANHVYLWNYEKVTYSKAPLIERTVPQILAIWTKDGEPGRGIDSITNKYKVTDTNAVPKREHEGGTGWQTSPIAPAKGQYLWNYEIITWTKGTSPTYTDVQQIGYAGTDGIGVSIDEDNTFIRYAKSATKPNLNKDLPIWKTTIEALGLAAGDTYWTWVHTAYTDTNYTDVCNPGYYGTNGTNGKTPYINNGYWYIDGQSTGVKAEGDDGETPYIGANGNWWIGTTDTGVQAQAQSALHCDLSNTIDGVAMTAGGKVTAQVQVATTLTIFYGTDPQTLTDLTWSALPTGITATRNGGTVTFTIAKDTQLTNDKAEITLTGKTARGNLSAVFTIQGFRAGNNGTSPVIYQLVPSENEIKKNKAGTYTPITLTCGITKRDGNNAPVEYTGSEVTIKMSIDGKAEQDYAAITTNTTKPSLNVTYKLYHGTTLIDVETVPVVEDGVDGTSPYFVDIDNEMDSVACDASGKTTAAYSKTVKTRIWHGSAELDLKDIVISGTTANVTATKNVTNKTVTISVDRDKQIDLATEITITPQADGAPNDQSVHFVLNGVRPGTNGQHATTYSLVPDVSEIVLKKNGTFSPDTFKCHCTSLTNGTATDNPSGATMEYSYNGTDWTVFTATTSFSSSTINTNGGKLYLRLKVNNKEQDKETIPVVADGENGVGSRIETLTTRYAKGASDGSQPTALYTDTDVWKDSIAATNPAVGDFIWSLYGVTPYTIDKSGNSTEGETMWIYAVERIGADGTKGYSMHTAYADSAPNAPSGTGVTGFSTTMLASSKFIGICVSQQQSTTGPDDDPTDPTAYEWAKFEGSAGTSPYFADIDEEMDSVACDADGKITAAYSKTVNVSLWHGSTKMGLSDIVIKDKNGTEVTRIGNVNVSKNADNGTVTVSVANGASIPQTTEFFITPQATGAPNSQVLHFVLNGIRPGADGSTPTLFSIVPNTDAIIKKKNGTTNVDYITCSISTTEGQPEVKPAYGVMEYPPSDMAHEGETVLLDYHSVENDMIDVYEDGYWNGYGVPMHSLYKTYGQLYEALEEGWHCCLKYSIDDGSYQIYENRIPVSSITKNIRFVLEVNGIIRDTETIPLVEDGTDGKSIIKQSEVTYYIKNTTGVRPAENDPNWSTTKPTIGNGEWLFTKTDILWSDGSHTILYTDERNPNDGIAGMDIVAGTTTITYCVKDSNSSQPADSEFKAYSEIVSQIVPGKWLWSKSTTPYYKGSTSGASAGSSSNYNVSYIGTNGSSITKKSEAKAYQVSNNGTTVPTGTWLDEAHKPTPSQGQYLWTRTIITWSDNSTTTLYSAERNPNDGDSVTITGQSVTYTTKSAGNVKPETITDWGDYPTSLSKGEWLYSKTTVTYSDNTSTVSYAVSYIGNDGTSVVAQYSVNGTSNWHSTYAATDKYMRTSADGGTTWGAAIKIVGENGENGDYIDSSFGISAKLLGDNQDGSPSDISAWSDEPVATTEQKPYLWCKQVSHTFNGTTETTGTPKYIRITGEVGPQGANGRAMTGGSEHYNVSNDSTTPPATVPPSGDWTDEWTTNPNVPDSQGNTKWKESAKYLWNYEKITYQESDGTTTIQRTTPRVIAIWTKDGRGIDSIVNKYAISASGTQAPAETMSGAQGWDDDPIAPNATYPYLWNYEIIYWTDDSTPGGGYGTAHVIGHYGKDGDNGIDGEGTEQVFIRTNSETPPYVDNDIEDSYRRTYLNDEYLPRAKGSSLGATGQQCTDDPQGVSATYPYEWVIKRGKTAPDQITGKRTWEKFTGKAQQATAIFKEDFSSGSTSGWSTSVSGRISPTIITDGANKFLAINQNERDKNQATLTGTTLSGANSGYADYFIECDILLAAANTDKNSLILYAPNNAAFFKITHKDGDVWTVSGSGGTTTDVTLYNTSYVSGGRSLSNTNWYKYQIVHYKGKNYITIRRKTDYSVLLNNFYLGETSDTIGTIQYNSGRYLGNFAIDNIIVRTLVKSDLPTDLQSGFGDYGMSLWATYAEDAVNVMLSPEEVIVTQATSSPYNIDLTNAETVVSVDKGGTLQSNFSISNISGVNCNASLKSGTTNTIKITAILNDGDNYYESGYVTFYVNFGGQSYPKRFNFYANLLGTWKQEVEAGTETIIATKVNYDFVNGVLTKDNRDYNSIRNAAIANETWKSQKEATYDGYSAQITSLNTSVSTAEGNISTVSKSVNLMSGSWMKNESGFPNSDYDALNDRHYDSGSANDIYSPVIYLAAGRYCFSGYVPDGRYFDTNGNTIELMEGCTTDNPTSGSMIQATSVGTVNGDTMKVGTKTYYRRYAIFDVSSNDLCSINLWGSADEADVAVPHLVKGGSVDANATMSQIKQTADSIMSVVSTKASQSQLTQTASEIRLEVEREIGANLLLYDTLGDWECNYKDTISAIFTDPSTIKSPFVSLNPGTYTLSCNNESNGDTGFISLKIYKFGVTDPIFSAFLEKGRVSYTFTLEQEETVQFRFSKATIDQTKISITEPKLEPGTIAHEYGSTVSSSISQTADNIKLEVKEVNDGLSATGIDIKHQEIHLYGGKVVMDDNLYVPKVISENDAMKTVVEAGVLRIESKITNSYGIFAINPQNEIVLQFYDKDGNMVLNLGGSPNAMEKGSWTDVLLKKVNTSTTSKTEYIAYSEDCVVYKRLTLGKLRNTNNVLQYFLPGGGQTTDTNVIARDGCLFDTRSTQDTEAFIKTTSFIPDGQYVTKNNGIFFVEGDREVVKVYTYKNGKITTTTTIYLTE